MADLPSGTVTFFFSDIEGSTRLLDELGAETYGGALADHRRAIRTAVAQHGGVEVDTQGDAFFVAFADAAAAVAAAEEATRTLAAGPIRVRMGLHTGTPVVAADGYVGRDVHLGARIATAGHGGQVLLSKETRQLLGDRFELTDQGEHRLKDFAEPVWIYQLGTERFPPLKTISNSNLPRPVSSFVGREREVDAVTELLRNGARLVTLTGPGGTGKTRLAIEAAKELIADNRNGVFWVPLAAVADSALVLAEIAQTLGAGEKLAQHIGDREILLLIDNFEHLLEAAPEVAVLLRACPNLKMLITSRVLLDVSGEVQYQVPALAETEAVALFTARSGIERSREVVELCQSLDNLPLAVELAAARTRVLSPSQILARLGNRLDAFRGARDADPRQRTLRATIEWSHDLLDPDQAELFARMAVFAGGCTLEAAEGVAGAQLDLLDALVTHSLVRQSGERFWMLETIREFAAERLAAGPDAASVRERHARFYLDLAEAAEPHLLEPDRDSWLNALEDDHDNIRLALETFDSTGQTDEALRLSGAIGEFWDQRTHQAEAVRWYSRLLNAQREPSSARAKALDSASMVATKVGDMDMALRWGEEALALYRALGNKRGTATMLWGVGYLRLETGDPHEAAGLLGDSVRLFRETADMSSLAWATRGFAYSHYRLGNIEKARDLYEENLRLATELGDVPLSAAMMADLAKIAADQGRFDDARSLARESLGLCTEVRDRVLSLSILCSIASVLCSVGELRVATQLISFADAQYIEMQARESWVDTMNEQSLALVHEELDEATFTNEWNVGRQLAADDATSLAIAALGGRQ